MRYLNCAREWATALVMASSLILGGCASTGGGADPSDPLESFNRGVYDFNKGVDDALLKPVARGYQAITPDFVDRTITNLSRMVLDEVA